jgi:hypothetical protein
MSLRTALVAAVTTISAVAVVFAALSTDLHGDARPGPATVRAIPSGLASPTPSRARPAPKRSRAQTARARTAYVQLSPARAARTAATTFHKQLTGPVQGMPRLGRGSRIVRYLNDHVAQTKDRKGPRAAHLDTATAHAHGRQAQATDRRSA